ncbi:MAG TPA: hypothetical protein VND65_17955 [Candidatus Binatia bacterium]|nr:hypothetical protein [Candidatus Binatia bacterium]
MASRVKMDLSHAWLANATIGFGIQVYALFVPEFPSPIGLVWGTLTGGKRRKFEVHGSFVHVFHRRNGIRTKINELLLESECDVIFSDATTPEGEKFMRAAAGYKLDPHTGWWVLTK